MTRHASDAWIGAAVLLAGFSFLSYVSHVVIAAVLVVYFSVVGLAALAVLHLWLSRQRELQGLACVLLTLPVLLDCGIVSAMAVGLTMWLTHVGHMTRLAIAEPQPSGAETGA